MSSPLENLDPAELASLSDKDFQEKVRHHARGRISRVLTTIEDVMDNSDDDQARLIAATKYLKIAKAEEEEKSSFLPPGVSEEVFKIALAGIAQLASIARDTTATAKLINITPARTDPRPFIPDDSPLNTPPTVSPTTLVEGFDTSRTIEENAHEENEEDQDV